MSLYQRPDSELWYINIVVPGQPRIRRSTGTSDRREAQRIHDEVKGKAWSAPKLAGKTWGNAVLKWCSVEDRSESELLSLAKFAKHFPDRRLSDVTPEAIDKALGFCKTAGTYMRYRTMIAAILTLSEVKLKLHVRKDKKKKPRQWITHEEWEKLYAELPKHQQPMAKFAVETGLRQSNVLGLTWDRVDMTRKLVWIEAEDMKSGEAHPVPLSDGAMDVLQAVQETHPEFVFTFRGKPIGEIKTAFQAACIRAGIGAFRDGHYSGFTWHGLRHTWATWHVQAGTPLGVLKELGAWSDLRMVLLYAHHSAGHVADYANNSSRQHKARTLSARTEKPDL